MTSLLKCYVQKEDENLVLVEPEVDVEEANVDEAPNAEHARQDTSEQDCKEDCTTEDTIEDHIEVQDAMKFDARHYSDPPLDEIKDLHARGEEKEHVIVYFLVFIEYYFAG